MAVVEVPSVQRVPVLRGERLAGSLLTRVGPAGGIAVVGVSVLGALLVPLHLWQPWLVWPLTLAVVAGAWWCSGLLPSRPSASWATALSVLLSAGFSLWAALTHAQHVIVRRDAGSYALYTQWIATRGGLPIPSDLARFGGLQALDLPGFTLASPAFYQVTSGSGAARTVEVVPQFLVGSPAVYSLGWWLGAPFGRPWTGVQVLPGLVTGLALLCFAGLAARLIGPAWAPVAVAALGLTFPVLHVARSTYSEPVALLVVLAGACLVVDALTDHQPASRLGLLAGSVLGLAGLIRVDAVREVALLVGCCAVLAVTRHRAAVPLAASALVTTLLSIAVWYEMSRPYVDQVSASLRPLLAAALGIAVLALVVVPIAWRTRPRWRPLVDRLQPWATPVAAVTAAGVVAVGLLMAARPLFLVVRQDPNDPGSRYVSGLQRLQGLPVDGGRTYAEASLTWVSWYVGWLPLVAALLVLAVLAGRAVAAPLRRGPSQGVPRWAVVSAVGFGSTLLVLYRPGITPDHPWADRRLVPVLLPTLTLAATAGLAWLVRVARRRAAAWMFALAVVAGLLALLLPAVAATAPLAGQRTERGQTSAVEKVCRSLAPGDVVVAVDANAAGLAQRPANEWVQVVRGICDRPSAALLVPVAQLPAGLTRLATLVQGAGGRLVALTAQENDAAAKRVLAAAVPAGTPSRITYLQTTEDLRWLTRPPDGDAKLVVDVWTVVVPAAR